MSNPARDAESSVPVGWSTALLGEMTALITSGSRGWSAYYSSEGARFIRVGDFNRGAITLSLGTMSRVAPPNDAEGQRTSVRSGDVLLTITADVGMVAVTPPELGTAYVNQHVALIRPLAGLNPQCLAYSLLDPAGFQRVVRTAQYGATKAGLSLQQIRGFEVKVPPQGEQGRIVDILDSYITRVEAASEGLKRVEANLKRYRASVLKAAVEGRLVPTEAELAKKEGRSYESASVFLDRILTERRRCREESALAGIKAKGETAKNEGWRASYQGPLLPEGSEPSPLPDGWAWTTLDAFLCDIEAGRSFKCEERPPEQGEVGVVKVSAVTWGVYDENESKTCTRADLIDEKLFVREGDLLFSRANTIDLVGAVVIVGRTSRRIMLSDKILRLNSVGFESWLVAVLRSPLGRRQIEALSTGNQESMRNIGQSRIRQICVPIPPETEMERILLALADADSLGEHATATVEANSVRVARLRQSILKWAFEGKLVDQSPNDEPASVLVARIKAERDQQPAPSTNGLRAARAKAKRAVVA